MPVTFFPEDDQKSILDAHNQGKQRLEKIPVMNRNAQTGWPLFQVSLFTPTVANTQRYEHALGGGKCHFFYIGAFNFACMLTKIPGNMTVIGNYGTVKDRKDLVIDNVAMFLENFSVSHQVLGLKITSESGMYGKTLEVGCPEGAPDKLKQGLYEPFSFALKTGANLHDVGAWKDSPSLSQEEIQDRINEDVATFSSGQIFVDLGEFLERKVKDPEIKEFFKTIFKVDEFIALQKDNAEFKPAEVIEPVLEPVPQSEPTPIIPSALASVTAMQQADAKSISPALVSLYSKIESMRAYGQGLVREDSNALVAIKLADDLKKELDAFNKQVLQAHPTNKEIAQFQSKFKTLLHSQDSIMSEHRAIWKPIVANILLSLGSLGIGFLAIGIKAGVSVYRNYKYGDAITVSNVLFFAQTEREKKIESIEDEVKFDENTSFSLENETTSTKML